MFGIFLFEGRNLSTSFEKDSVLLRLKERQFGYRNEMLGQAQVTDNLQCQAKEFTHNLCTIYVPLKITSYPVSWPYDTDLIQERFYTIKAKT